MLLLWADGGFLCLGLRLKIVLLCVHTYEETCVELLNLRIVLQEKVLLAERQTIQCTEDTMLFRTSCH